MFSIHCLITANVWKVAATTEPERIRLSVILLERELKHWYTQQDKDITLISHLTPGMFGTCANQKLALQGAETNWFLPFVAFLIDKYEAELPNAALCRKLANPDCETWSSSESTASFSLTPLCRNSLMKRSVICTCVAYWAFRCAKSTTPTHTSQRTFGSSVVQPCLVVGSTSSSMARLNYQHRQRIMLCGRGACCRMLVVHLVSVTSAVVPSGGYLRTRRRDEMC